MMMRRIWIDSEEKRESEENAESDESEEEGEGSDPEARKTRINHVLWMRESSDYGLIQKK